MCQRLMDVSGVQRCKEQENVQRASAACWCFNSQSGSARCAAFSSNSQQSNTSYKHPPWTLILISSTPFCPAAHPLLPRPLFHPSLSSGSVTGGQTKSSSLPWPCWCSPSSFRLKPPTDSHNAETLSAALQLCRAAESTTWTGLNTQSDTDNKWKHTVLHMSGTGCVMFQLASWKWWSLKRRSEVREESFCNEKFSAETEDADGLKQDLIK